MQWFYIGKLFLAGAAMAGTAWLTHEGLRALMPDALATIAAMIAAGLIYIICLFAFRALSSEDVRKLPFIGRRLYPWVKKLEL
jgi:stage V sporulation protein B